MKQQRAEQPTAPASSSLVADARLHDLPEALSSFIGRSAELTRVRQLLGEARLLTLVGVGGCGKTRLALQSAADGTARFAHGVWWVELAALEDGELLATTVSGALAVRERPGVAPLDLLREHLRDRRVLLVLDNCEHVLGGCATLVDALLRSCRGLVVLATSREPLGVPGELPYRVPSLSLPAQPFSLQEVMPSDAVALFVDRAIQARPSFALSEANAPAVAEICRRLDGIPLAIELAAACVRMLSPARIAAELDDRFRLLTGGGRSVAARHKTLRASIDWSHELCSEQERLLLRRLSVWAGGWTLDGAAAVSADDTLDRRAVLELMTGLVDKSLVETEEREGEIRYRMLETIRQYAAERLADAGEVQATQTRHVSWCLELAERADPQLVRHDARVWLRRLEPEAANLRAALDRAIVIDSDVALRLAAALTFFWLLRGRLDEGTTALARAVDAAPQPSAVRGRVLWGLAELNIWRGRLEACLTYAQLALADGEAAADPGVMARALKAKGLILSLRNHLDRTALERSLALAREAGDEWCTADVMRLLGSSHVRQSQHDMARPILDESYELARTLGHQPLHAWYFGLRAWGELEHGRLREARELAEQARLVSEQIGEPVALGLATSLLVECDVLQGLPGEGRIRGERCVEVIRSAGVGSAEIWLQNALSLVDVAEGIPNAARERIETLLRVTEQARPYDIETKARRRLAVALLLMGHLDEAERAAQQLLAAGKTGGNEHVEAMARHLLGRVALARGAVIEAERHLHDALAIADRRDFRLQTLNTLESLARVAAQTDSPVEAARLLAAVRTCREQWGIARWPPEPDAWAQLEHDIQTELGDAAFASACQDGVALSANEAVGYASRGRGERKRPARGWDSLTPTELEIVRHVAAGLTNPQIAESMFISRATVKAHLSHVYAKLAASSRFELTAEARRRGLNARNATDAAAG